MKVLANDGISQAGIDVLESAGYVVLTDKVEQHDLIQTINSENIGALLVRSATTVRKDLIDACPNLKLIGRGGVGMDNIDVEYGRENGRLVVNTPGASSQSVAELVMGHLFSISRSLHDSYKNMSDGDFKVLKKKYGKGVELRGKKLVIVGFGRIGQNLASYALGCGMNVVAIDTYTEARNIILNLGNGVSASTTITPVSDMMPEIADADYISLHIPKQADGSAVISTAEFAAMKNGVRIVNAARGGVVDEEALYRAIKNGDLGGAALDVFEKEPATGNSLAELDNVILTPHIGAQTKEAQSLAANVIGEKIIQILRGVI